MATRASKSKRPASRPGEKVKKGLNKPSAGKRSRKVDPIPGPRPELIEPTQPKTEQPVVDPLPGGDPFDL